MGQVPVPAIAAMVCSRDPSDPQFRSKGVASVRILSWKWAEKFGDHHSLDIAGAGKNLNLGFGWFWGKTQLIIIVNDMIYSSDW